MDELQCWACGVRPEGVDLIMSPESVEPVSRIVSWPAGGDHVHAESPPSPGELIAEAFHLLRGRA